MYSGVLSSFPVPALLEGVDTYFLRTLSGPGIVPSSGETVVSDMASPLWCL